VRAAYARGTGWPFVEQPETQRLVACNVFRGVVLGL
jgi:hypothetical protein